MGQYQVYQFACNESSRKIREKERDRNFLRNNDQTLHKSDEKILIYRSKKVNKAKL